MMSGQNKLLNFPTVNYISLKSAVHRQQFMNSQFEKYGISYTPYITVPFNEMLPDLCVYGKYINSLCAAGMGAAISHLRCMNRWYHETNDEYAIFCEDDHDFFSIDHWNFTWDDFMANLPSNWRCIQLVRIEYPLKDITEKRLNLDMRYGRWWGGLSLMRRDWVKQILDRHVMADNIYKLEVDDMMPIVENILYWNLGVIYNFPLFVENNNVDKKDNLDVSKIPHHISEQRIRSKWMNFDNNTKIENLLGVVHD